MAELTDIRETHRVHEQAAAAIIRANKPAPGCCSVDASATCCEPADKAACCGPAADTPPSSCGCQ
jgi:hypothetical protein